MIWDERDRERFTSKVAGDDRGCWIWQGAIFQQTGYGVFNARSDDGVWRPHTAHRAAYLMFVGPISDGLQIDHLCRVRACCKPSHLEAVTNRENVLRGTSPAARQALQTHCYKGHPLSGYNLILRPNTRKRECRTCAQERDRRRTKRPPIRRWDDPAELYAEQRRCGQGHLFDDANTYWWEGRYSCRACRTAQMRRQRAKRQ
jgi:hypothetical protein